MQSFLNDRENYQQDLASVDNLETTQTPDAEEKMGSTAKQDIAKENETGNDSESEQNKGTTITEDGLIGILSIDRINLRVAIAEGTDKEALRYSVGHFTDTALPGEPGNACFTGHRSYAFGEYFNRLDEVAVGDRIQILTLDQTLEYEVTESFVVEPEETWVLDPTEEETITLITCTPVRIATHRLIIRAKRI